MKAVNCCMSFSFKINVQPVSSYIPKISWAASAQANTLKPINSKNAYKIETYREVLDLILKDLGTIFNILFK